MLIVSDYGNQENSSLIEFIKESFSEDVLIFHSSEDICQHIEKEKKVHPLTLIFVQEIERTSQFIDAVTKILEKENLLTFYIAVVEPDLEGEKEFFENNFQAYFLKPIDNDSIITELESTKEIVMSLYEEMAPESTDTKKEGKDTTEEDENIEYFFDREFSETSNCLSVIKTGTHQEKKDIYQIIRKNIVWPGKLLAKNSSDGSLQYDKNYFSYDKDAQELKAKAVGFIELKYFQLNLFPAVEVSEDLMEGHGYIFPIEEKEKTEAVSLYLEGLKNLGITKGVLEDKISEYYEKVLAEQFIDFQEVARGEGPEEGHAEYIEVLKKKKKEVGKIIDRLGTIDYREHSDIINVKKGEVVAKKIEAKPEKQGFTITGKNIKAKLKKVDTYNIGVNIKLNEKKEYTATIDGMLVFDKKTIHLLETLVIKGDVNLKLGNIHSERNVIIHGSVEQDMVVEAKGNIVIKGSVEDAKIMSDGNIQVHGLIGSGKTWVFCKGSVEIDFCQDSHVEAFCDIIIKKYSINSELNSNNNVVGLDNSKIIGGEIKTAIACELFELGNPQETPGKVILGVNFYSQKRLNEISSRIKLLQKENKLLLDILKEYLDLSKPIKPQMSSLNEADSQVVMKKIKQYKKMQGSIKKYKKGLEETIKEIKEIKEKKIEQRSHLAISNKIYPNIEITIGQSRRKIKQIFQAVHFSFSPREGEIVFAPYLKKSKSQ